MSASMQVIVAGEQQQVQWQHRPQPQVAADEVLIKVAYSGMNRADLMQLAGHYPPPPGASDVLGLEVSGMVHAVGTNVGAFKVGDRVCALLTGGGYAEYVAVPATQVLPVPAKMDLAQAAGICEVFATAWYNVYGLAAAQPGERILVHAAASGVGQALLQLARERGNPTFATAGSDEKLVQAQRLGAEKVWNRRNGSFVDAVKAWGGVDIILDPVAGDYVAWDQQVLNQDGRLIVIGLMGGREAQLDAGRLLMKRQRIIGSTLRSQPLQVKARIMAELYAHVWPLFEQARITPNIDEVIPVGEVEQAFQRLRDNATQGKLILVW
ncbi:NAD(P)H-quinone oxidoreductase [Pseudidiomarina marina]|uniref:NAD(P)H-quinone oxidoreductase n=1 Tax=Pseudidiomarina marina TaxID=502366 RepID=UPI00384D1286